MTVLQRIQDPSDTLIWTFDYTDTLAANGGTISSAVVSTDVAGAVTSNKTVASPLVTIQLACAAVPKGTLVGLTCLATLSTGELQSRTHYILVDDT